MKKKLNRILQNSKVSRHPYTVIEQQSQAHLSISHDLQAKPGDYSEEFISLCVVVGISFWMSVGTGGDLSKEFQLGFRIW